MLMACLTINLKSSLRLFADDALLYGVISNEEDGDQLQDDVRQLEVWQSKCYSTPQNDMCISTKNVPPRRISFFLVSN